MKLPLESARHVRRAETRVEPEERQKPHEHDNSHDHGHKNVENALHFGIHRDKRVHEIKAHAGRYNEQEEMQERHADLVPQEPCRPWFGTLGLTPA